MTTIIIEQGKLQKTHFEGVSELLQYLVKNEEDFNDPNFEDTLLNDDHLKRAKATRDEFHKNPDKFKQAVQ